MLTRIIKLIVIVFLIGGVAYGGLCVYANIQGIASWSQPTIPDSSKASYSVKIKATNNTLLTNEVEIIGSDVGSRIITLRGFWQMGDEGSSFKYNKNDITLDESIFGEIVIRRR